MKLLTSFSQQAFLEHQPCAESLAGHTVCRCKWDLVLDLKEYHSSRQMADKLTWQNHALGANQMWYMETWGTDENQVNGTWWREFRQRVQWGWPPTCEQNIVGGSQANEKWKEQNIKETQNKTTKIKKERSSIQGFTRPFRVFHFTPQSDQA